MSNQTLSTAAASGAVQVTQEDEDDEFHSYCLPNNVLIKLLEEAEEELGLNDNSSRSPSPEAPPSLTQMVDDDYHATTTTSQQDAADRKRLISHMLQMRANLERYVSQKLAGQALPQGRMLYQKIQQFASMKTHPKNVSLPDFMNSMHTIRDYGNRAAHNQAAMPNRDECLAAVAKYSTLKADYENS